MIVVIFRIQKVVSAGTSREAVPNVNLAHQASSGFRTAKPTWHSTDAATRPQNQIPIISIGIIGNRLDFMDLVADDLYQRSGPRPGDGLVQRVAWRLPFHCFRVSSTVVVDPTSALLA